MSEFELWTSDLSPFSLKIKSCLLYTGHTYRCLPKEGGKLRNLYTAFRIARGTKKGSITKYPAMTPLDEYPGVPFLIEPNGSIQYDSTAIASWLDNEFNKGATRKLWPQDPKMAFVARLIDEAMDEFCIYLAHYMRWVRSIKTNDAGERLFQEMSRIPFVSRKKNFPVWFSRRQVVRLPYLFSMPPKGFDAGVSEKLSAPVIEGWPETFSLLEQAWLDYLAGLENVLAVQPYLLGNSFTIADASTYGMIGMLLDDPSAAEDMKQRAPITYQWLVNIKNGQHVSGDANGELEITDALLPLLDTMMNTFVPLMKQNETAYLMHKEQGETLFNEPALRKRKSIYQGVLNNKPFKAVVKTFQLQVWRDLSESWNKLSDDQRTQLEHRIYGLSGFTDAVTDTVKI